MLASVNIEGKPKETLVQVSATLDLKLGGPTSVVTGLRESFTKNFELQLLVFGKVEIEYAEALKISTLFGNRYGLVLIRPSKEVRISMQESSIVLIHGFYLASTLYALHYAKTRNVFLMPHGSLEEYQEARGPVRKYIFRKLFLLLSGDRRIHFMVGSESETISIRRIFPKNPITVVGLGVDPKIQAASKISGLKKDILSEPVILGCLSRISEKKRIDLCIRTLALLNSPGTGYKLRIFGTGDESLERILRKLVIELKLEDFVTFEGFVENDSRIAALQDIDILLLPSENENFAVAVAESIASGKPVVVSKFVAMHNFVQSHHTGVVIPSLDVAQIALAVEEIVGNYQEYRQNCLKSAKLISWDKVIENWLLVLNQVV